MSAGHLPKLTLAAALDSAAARQQGPRERPDAPRFATSLAYSHTPSPAAATPRRPVPAWLAPVAWVLPEA